MCEPILLECSRQFKWYSFSQASVLPAIQAQVVENQANSRLTQNVCQARDVGHHLGTSLPEIDLPLSVQTVGWIWLQAVAGSVPPHFSFQHILWGLTIFHADGERAGHCSPLPFAQLVPYWGTTVIFFYNCWMISAIKPDFSHEYFRKAYGN